jgi:Negative regulator of sigma F
LAAAGLANFFLRLFHPEDVTVMLLCWHVGGVFLLSALAASVGEYLLNWGSVTDASENTAR